MAEFREGDLQTGIDQLRFAAADRQRRLDEDTIPERFRKPTREWVVAMDGAATMAEVLMRRGFTSEVTRVLRERYFESHIFGQTSVQKEGRWVEGEFIAADDEEEVSFRKSRGIPNCCLYID